MTTSEDEVRNATVEMLMNGAQADRDKFIICTLMDIKQNGCAQRCNDQAASIMEKWTPAAVLTLVQGALMGLLEYSRK